MTLQPRSLRSSPRTMMTTNRRDFLKRSALAGTGLLFLRRAAPLLAAPARQGRMGALTALALSDDALHLAGAAPNLAPALRESLAFGINVFEPLPGNAAFFGRLMPAAPSDVVALIGAARDGWDRRTEDDRYELKLALAAGWLVQHAGAQVIEPSLADAPDAAEAQAAQDAAVARARSAALGGSAQAEEIAALFREMAPRTLVRFHTLIPDYDDPKGWVTRLVAWRQEHAQRMDAYAQAFVDTRSATHQRYVADPNFYDADDPVLRLARQVRSSESPTPVDLAAAVEGANASLYGRGLARGVGHLLSLSSHLEGGLDAHSFEQQLKET